MAENLRKRIKTRLFYHAGRVAEERLDAGCQGISGMDRSLTVAAQPRPRLGRIEQSVTRKP